MRRLPPPQPGFSGYDLPRGYVIWRGPHKDQRGVCFGWRKGKRGRIYLYAVNEAWRQVVAERLQKLRELHAPDAIVRQNEELIPRLDLSAARLFANDIANGWLEEIEQYLRERSCKARAQIQVLEQAQDKRLEEK